MSQVIVTTGMHRSGTSLVSSLLQEAGVHVGDQLIAANVANPRGYFEDVDFYEFHEHLLHQRGQSYLHVDEACAFAPTPDELERAQQLLSQRAERPLWGWKDPRTALFLAFWYAQLPEARFLFVFRHPLAVLFSLLRRGEFDGNPCLAAGLQAWQVYDAKIRAFYDEHPDQCLLVHIDALVGQFQRFADLLEHKLGLNLRLDPAAFDRIFHAEELQNVPFPKEAVDVFARLFPEQVKLYDQLQCHADLPADAGRLPPAASPPLSALANSTAALPDPISLPVQHSLLQLLVSLLAPEAAEKMLGQFNHNAKGAQQKIDYLWLHAQRLERMHVEQSGKLQEEQIQSRNQQAQLSEQAARIQSLLAELGRVYETRTWKLIHTYSRIKERLHGKES